MIKKSLPELQWNFEVLGLLPVKIILSLILDLGQIELSFEYDSRKNSLRIRVWQISDIILPPGNHSSTRTHDKVPTRPVLC